MNDVLIVEDEYDVREFIGQTLRRAGIACRMAGTGVQALNQARLSWPGLVLLDLSLPGQLDGWQVWDSLYQMSAGRPLRVVIFAAEVSGDDRALADEWGALAIIVKPVRASQLVAIIQKTLSQN